MNELQQTRAIILCTNRRKLGRVNWSKLSLVAGAHWIPPVATVQITTACGTHATFSNNLLVKNDEWICSYLQHRYSLDGVWRYVKRPQKKKKMK